MLQIFLCEFYQCQQQLLSCLRSVVFVSYFMRLLLTASDVSTGISSRNKYGPINGTYILCLIRVSCKHFSSKPTSEEYQNTVLWQKTKFSLPMTCRNVGGVEVQIQSFLSWELHLGTLCSLLQSRRFRWSSGQHAGLCHPSLRVQTRPKPLDF